MRSDVNGSCLVTFSILAYYSKELILSAWVRVAESNSMHNILELVEIHLHTLRLHKGKNIYIFSSIHALSAHSHDAAGQKDLVCRIGFSLCYSLLVRTCCKSHYGFVFRVNYSSLIL